MRQRRSEREPSGPRRQRGSVWLSQWVLRRAPCSQRPTSPSNKVRPDKVPSEESPAPSPRTRDWGCPVFLWSSTVEKQRVQKPGALPRDRERGGRGPGVRRVGGLEVPPQQAVPSAKPQPATLVQVTQIDASVCSPPAAADPGPHALRDRRAPPLSRKPAAALGAGRGSPSSAHTPPPTGTAGRHDAVSVNRNKHARPVQGNGLKSTNKILSLLCIFQT